MSSFDRDVIFVQKWSGFYHPYNNMVDPRLLALQVLVRSSAVRDRVKRLALFHCIRIRINSSGSINENALLQEVIMKSLGGLEESFIVYESANGRSQSVLNFRAIYFFEYDLVFEGSDEMIQEHE